jgi:hypothetical protein
VQFGPNVFSQVPSNPLADQGSGNRTLAASGNPVTFRNSGGKFGQGIELSGTQLNANNIPYNAGPLTLCAVIDYDGATSTQIPARWLFRYREDSDTVFEIGILSEAGNPLSQWYVSQSVVGNILITSAPPEVIGPGRYKIFFQLVDATTPNALRRLVVNGAQKVSTTVGDQAGGTTILQIGGLASGGVSEYFAGAIYSLHIFPSLLSDEDAAAILADDGTDELFGGELGFWNFESFSVPEIAKLYIEVVTSGPGGAWSVPLGSSVIASSVFSAHAQVVGAGNLKANVTSIAYPTVQGVVVDAAGAPVVGAAVHVWIGGE